MFINQSNFVVKRTPSVIFLKEFQTALNSCFCSETSLESFFWVKSNPWTEKSILKSLTSLLAVSWFEIAIGFIGNFYKSCKYWKLVFWPFQRITLYQRSLKNRIFRHNRIFRETYVWINKDIYYWEDNCLYYLLLCRACNIA